jgi:hypothetical protein
MSDEPVNQDPQPDKKGDEKKGDEKPLSPAEQLELARLKAATAEAQARVATLERDNRDLTLVGTYETEIARSGIRSHLPQKELIKLVTSQPGATVIPSADGSVLHCELNGQPVKFSELLETFALANSYMFDGRSLKRLRLDEKLVQSLEDLPDRESRQDYIRKFGSDAIAALPAHPATKHADPAKTMTCEEYLSLRIGDRAKIAGEVGEAGVSKILQRKQEKK